VCQEPGLGAVQWIKDDDSLPRSKRRYPDDVLLADHTNDAQLAVVGMSLDRPIKGLLRLLINIHRVVAVMKGALLPL